MQDKVPGGTTDKSEREKHQVWDPMFCGCLSPAPTISDTLAGRYHLRW